MRYSTSVWGNQKKWIKQAFHPDSPSYPLPNRRCRCLYSLANTPALVGCNKPKGFRCSMTLATAVVPQMLDDKRGDLYGYCNTCPRVPCAFLHFWYLNINKNEKIPSASACSSQGKARQKQAPNNTQEQPKQQQERATTATDQQTNQPTNQQTNKTKRNQTKQNKTNKQTHTHTQTHNNKKDNKNKCSTGDPRIENIFKVTLAVAGTKWLTTFGVLQITLLVRDPWRENKTNLQRWTLHDMVHMLILFQLRANLRRRNCLCTGAMTYWWSVPVTCISSGYLPCFLTKISEQTWYLQILCNYTVYACNGQ